MDLLSIEIDNKKYTYIDSVILDEKKYVAFMDEIDVYVKEYDEENNLFQNISDECYKKVIEVLGI